jgi:hypothetical protein
MLLLPCVLAISTPAQDAKKPLPRLEDYTVVHIFKGPNAPVKIITTSERLYRTRMTNAGKESPDFAGRYKFAIWGCGSNCAAGAIIDLQTGNVYQPPMAHESE